MEIISLEVTDPIVLTLFSKHDEYMLEFLGEDKKYYSRYNENEKIEKVWVAYYENLPVGCIAYRNKGYGVGEVKRLFIINEYRGKGISKDLFKEVQEYAKEQGCNTLFLDTRRTLEPAVTIYLTWGFNIVFQQGLYIQMEKKI